MKVVNTEWVVEFRLAPRFLCSRLPEYLTYFSSFFHSVIQIQFKSYSEFYPFQVSETVAHCFLCMNCLFSHLQLPKFQLLAQRALPP